mgnify:CR=1 FL=1
MTGLLRRAGELGLIAPELAEQTADAYRSYRRAQHDLRLQGMSKAQGSPEEQTDRLVAA